MAQAHLRAARTWPDASFFGGPVTPRFEATPPEWITRNWSMLSNAFAERNLGPRPFAFDEDHVPYGPNLVVRTSVLRRYRFDPALGVVGPTRRGGEETDLVRRLLRDGHAGYWVPEAGVVHVVPADRMTLKHLGNYFIGLGRTRRRLRRPGHADGWAPWNWAHAMALEREYLAARRTGDSSRWVPAFVAARVARGWCVPASARSRQG